MEKNKSYSLKKRFIASLLVMCMIFLCLPFTDTLALADTNCVVNGTPYKLVNGVQQYDVTVNHVIINQVGGANATSPATNGFVELYNPTDTAVDLSNWSIQYKSSAAGSNADAWVKLNLTGTIGSHCSYLIRSKEMNPNGTFQVPEGDQEWPDVALYEKGFSVVLLDNQTLLAADAQPFDNTTKSPAVTGYVDMLAANGNDSLSTQKAPAYEKEASDIQSSKKSVRRVYFQDTDDNSESGDLEIVDYYTKDTNFIAWAIPRNSKDGAWEASDRPVPTQTTTLSATEPNALTNTIGKDAGTTRVFTWQMPLSFTSGKVNIYTDKKLKNKKVSVKAKATLNSLSDARIFRASATGLKAGTTYYYQIVCGNMTSETYHFTTDNQDKTLTFIHMSDTQALSEEDYSVWANSIQAVTNKYNPDFLVETGDEVSTKNSEDEWRWFFGTAKEQLSNLGLLPVVGNHEQDSRYFAEAFQDHFTMPNTCTNSTVTPGTVYSYDYGPVHFVVLNTENVDGYEAQKAWADKDMAATNQDYIIVMMHKGVYGGKGKNEAVFNAFASLFDKYSVPLVLFGHDHSYIRTQMKADEQDDEGTVYLQSGGSGIKHEYNNINCPDYAEIVAEPTDPTYSVITVTASKISVKTITVATDGTISPLEGNDAVLKQDASETVNFSITPQARKVTLNKSKATVKVGKKLTLTATVIPAKGKNATLTWKTSNQKVATVSKKGVVTAKKAGKATITATTANGKKVTCVVTVKKK